MEIIILRKVFYRRYSRCIVLLTYKSLGHTCGRRLPIIKRGRCNRRTGKAVDRVITFVLNRRRCTCVRRVRRRTRTCSCVHLGCKNSRTCRNGVLIFARTCYRLIQNSCHRIISLRYKHIVCNRPPSKRKVCRGSRGKLLTTTYRERKCRCVKVTKSRPIFCKCAKRRWKKFCRNPSIIRTLIVYILNKRMTKCRRIVLIRRTSVQRCRRTRKQVRGRCNRRTCKRKITTLIFGVRRCRCTKVRQFVRYIKCCCPKPYRRKTCNKRTGIVTKFSRYFTIVGGVCLSHARTVYVPTKCHAVRITSRPCNRRTRKRVILIRKYVRVGCSCRVKRRRIIQLCLCPVQRIKKLPCRPGKATRAVILIYFVLRHIRGRQKCIKKSRLLYREACRCRKTFERKVCDNNTHVRTIYITKMVRRLGQRVCITHIRTVRRLAVCKRTGNVIRSRCRNNVRTVRTLRWTVSNCRCHRVESKKTVPCDCRKKNKRRRLCLSLFYLLIIENWRRQSGFSACVMTRHERQIPIFCPKKIVLPLTRSCPIRRRFGFYRKYKIISYKLRRCKCIKQIHYTLRLCGCHRSAVKKRCFGRISETKRTKYVKRRGRCFREILVTRRAVVCSGRPISVRRFRCKRSGAGKACHRRIRVILRYVARCRCRHLVRWFRQICCPPPTTGKHERRYCHVRRGEIVIVRQRFYLVDSGKLFSLSGVVIFRKIVRSRVEISRRPIVCRRTRVKIHCNLKTGIKTVIVTTIRRIKCRCHKRIRVTKGKCKCPAPRTIRGPCRRHHRVVFYYFYVLIHSKCHRRSLRRVVRCSCPRGRKWKRCDKKGNWVHCKTVFVFNRATKTCIKRVRCNRRRVFCRFTRTTMSACNRRTGKKWVRRVWLALNARACRCVRRSRKWQVNCSCSHLNRRFKRCVGNFIETTVIRYKLMHGFCATHVRRRSREVVCPRMTFKYLRCNTKAGSKRAGYRRKIITWYAVVRCRCVRRIRKLWIPCKCSLIPAYRTITKRSCVRNVSLVIRIFWVLSHGRCIRRRREVRRSIICIARVRIKTGRCYRGRDGVYYKRIFYYSLKPRNCRCVWILTGSVIRVCRCRKNRLIVRCVKNRIISTTSIRHYRHLSRTHCRSVVKTRFRFVRCKRPKVIKGSCKRSTCHRRVVTITEKPVRCKCRSVRRVSRKRCCCHKKKRTRRRCSRNGLFIIIITVHFHFANGQCFIVQYTITLYLRCRRRPPQVRITRCRNNYRKRIVKTFYTHRCKCKAHTQVTRLRCGCRAVVITRHGRCRGRMWTTDRWLTQRFDKKTRTCKLVVTKSVRRRCRCPRGYSRTVCIKHDIRRTDYVRFRLNRRTNSCLRTRIRREFPIGKCKRTRILLRTISGRCNHRTGIQVDRLLYVRARGCRCRNFVVRKRVPCRCDKLHPIRRVLRCQGHNRRVLTIFLMVTVGKKCVPRKIRRSWIVSCLRWRTIRLPCSRSGYRWLRKERLVSRRCRCVWQTYKRIRVRCWCSRGSRRRLCIAHRIQRTITISYVLVAGRCYKRTVTVDRNVPCRVGRIRTHTRCRSGRYTIIRVERRLRKCVCLVKSFRRSCRCSCPKASRRVRCLAHHLRSVINTVYFLKNCACVRRRIARLVKVLCPPNRTNVGPCVWTSNRDGYRKFHRVSYLKRRCRCIRKIRRWRVLCRCARRRRRTNRCIGNRVRVITTTWRRRWRNTCLPRTLISRKRVNCGGRRVTVVCRGAVRITTIRTPYAFRCHCKVKTRIIKSRCRCDITRRLIRIGKCQKNCWRRNTYSYQVLRSNRCITRRIFRKERCCCSGGTTSSRSCDGRRGVIIIRTTKRIFIKGQCKKVTRSRRHVVRCSKRVFRRATRRPNGIVFVIEIYYTRRKCKCIRRRRTKTYPWACRHKYVRVTCVNRRYRKVVKVSYKLVKRVCQRIKVTKVLPILCPFMSRIDRPCKPVRFGYARSTIRTWYIVRNCRCRRRQHITTRICYCWRSRIRRVCNSSRGVFLTIRIRFVPSANGKFCKRRRTVSARRVRCNRRWRLYERSSCYFILWRQVRRGCRCKTEFRKKKRKTLCPRSRRIRFVCNHRTCRRRVLLIYYVKRRCVCHKRKHYIVEHCCHIICPDTYYRRVGPCRRGFAWYRIIYYRKVNGFCKKRTITRKLKLRCPMSTTMAVSQCYRGKRRYRITYYRRRLCRCMRRIRYTIKRCRCRTRVSELVFVIDGTMYNSMFRLNGEVQEYVMSLAASYKLGRKSVRLAIIKASGKPQVIFRLSDNVGKEFINLRKALWRRWGSRSVNMRNALRLALEVLRKSRKGARKHIVIISQGDYKYQKAVKALARKLKKNKVKITAIAVRASRIGMAKLKALTSKPKDLHFARLTSFQKMMFTIGLLNRQICLPITHY